jgi:hypothetical protein
MSSLFTDWIEGIGVELMLFGLAWLGWSLATRHLQHFFDLRLRVRRHIERMADADVSKRPAETAAAAPEREPSKAAEIAGTLGFELLSFAHRAPLSARLAKLLGYDAVKAGDQLISLSRDGEMVFRCRSVAQALRLREDAPQAQ